MKLIKCIILRASQHTIVTVHQWRKNVVRGPALMESQFNEDEIQYDKGKSRAGEKGVNLLWGRLKVGELYIETIIGGRIKTSRMLL